MDTAMMPQAIGQAPFYYYSPENKNEIRQHGHFSPQQPMQQMAMYNMVPLPSTPVYSRPNSASNALPPTLYSNGPSAMTPAASPQPMTHKPAILLESELYDNSYFPSTPPLSTSGSTIGSPNTCEILQTPMNPMFSGLDGLEVPKDVLEPAENTVLDWSSCGSPPMTPVYLQQSQPASVPSLSNTTSDLNSLPSLSPSPAPYARSVASQEQDVDFCDPRNLTVSAAGSVNSTLAPEFTLLGEESLKVDQTKVAAAPQAGFEFNPTLSAQGLPAFEDISDLESEDDFVNSLVNLTGDQAVDAGRPRACTGSSVVSLGHGSFIGDEDLSFDDNEAFQFPALSSPPTSTGSDDSHKDKRVKTTKQDDCIVAPDMNVAATSTQDESAQQVSSPAEDAEAVSDSNSSGSEGPTPMPAPANRRGRKQSLTEDPSKTFVCDLCNRRFRRQEHLKRHYRSLHTQEKPFECNECGKKFSRSDNLAQHARTHGSGAIVMNLIEDGEARAYEATMMGQPAPAADDYSAYGKVLFQIASEVPGSASEVSSDDGSDQGKKKRKRSD